MVIYKLGEVCFVTKLSGFEYSKYFINKTKNGDVPLIQASDISGNKLNFDNVFKISNELSSMLQRSKPTYGDVIFSYVGTVGNNYLVRDENIHLGSNVAIIRPNEMLLSKYLYYFVNSKKMLEELNKYVKGTSQKNIKMEDIRKITLLLPEISVQQSIIDIIEPIEMMENNVTNQILNIKSTLIHKYDNLASESINIESVIKHHKSKYSNQTEYFATNAVGEFDIDVTKVIDISNDIPSRAAVTPCNNSFIFSKLQGENKICYFSNTPKEVYSTGFFNVITSSPDHFAGFVLSNSYKSQKDSFSTGTTMTGLGNETLSKMKIKKPMDTSHDLVSHIEKLNNLKLQLAQLKGQLINLLVK